MQKRINGIVLATIFTLAFTAIAINSAQAQRCKNNAYCAPGTCAKDGTTRACNAKNCKKENCKK